MSVPDELQPYIKKIIVYACLLVLSYLAMFVFKIAVINLITGIGIPGIGEENAAKLVGLFFLTPSKLIIDQYGIGLYSIVLVVAIAIFSEKKGYLN